MIPTPTPGRGRPGPAPPDTLIVDDSLPMLGRFLRYAHARGLIRTIPIGPGRFAVLPGALWDDPIDPADPAL